MMVLKVDCLQREGESLSWVARTEWGALPPRRPPPLEVETASGRVANEGDLPTKRGEGIWGRQ